MYCRQGHTGSRGSEDVGLCVVVFGIITIAIVKKASIFSGRTIKRLLSDMGVFEFLTNFRVVVCKLCQSAAYPSAIGTHLRRSYARYNSSSASKIKFGL